MRWILLVIAVINAACIPVNLFDGAYWIIPLNLLSIVMCIRGSVQLGDLERR
jgi:uncharacterized integral membrane protein